MKKWKEGEVVREDYTMKIPPDVPSGRYDIVIGLWNPGGSKERLNLRGNGRNELKAGSIEISL
jgi:hypothetical protein